MGLSGDQLLFKTKTSNTFVPLSTSIRKPNNFFNGCITNENSYVIDRTPNSKNTLGYDTCLLTIPNENNAVIANNTNEATIRLKSTGDRYFMFFTAYCVDVTEPTQEAIASMQKSNEERLKEDTAELTEVKQEIKTLTETVEKETPKVEIIPVKEETKTVIVQKIEQEKPKVETPPAIDKKEIKQEIKQVTKAEIKEEVKKQVLADKEDIKNSIFKGIKEDLIAELKREIEAEIKEEVRNEVKAEIKEEFKKEYKKQIKKELKEQLKNDIQQSLTSNQTTETTTTVTETQPVKQQETITPTDKEETQPVANTKKPSIVYEKLDTVYSGFYLVANVFSNPLNASNFIKSLEKRGLKPNSFYNNTAKLTYVYLAKVENEEEAKKLYESKFDGAYQDPMWILVIIKEKQ